MDMKKGFSLVELSIVLVILGLLVGGVLAGQSLIRAAELRSVTTDYQRYQAAIYTFRGRYLGMPGDLSNATQFWGRQVNAAHCVTNSSAAVNAATGACDGDGDGVLVNAAPNASESSESFQTWRHMGLAGIVEGSYTGLAGTGSGQEEVPGSNIAQSKLSNAGWDIRYSGNFAGDSTSYALDYGNFIRIGATVTGSFAGGPLLAPEEAWNIDTKLDDGKPARGKVIARYYNNLCAAADDGSHLRTNLNASYKLTDKTAQCSLYFVRAF